MAYDAYTKVPLTTIAARLEKAISADVGMHGLNILLYGWAQKRNYGKFWKSIRKRENGEPFLYYDELISFSRYAGYDLTQDFAKS